VCRSDASPTGLRIVRPAQDFARRRHDTAMPTEHGSPRRPRLASRTRRTAFGGAAGAPERQT